MQVLAACVALFALSSGLGEPWRRDVSAVSWRSLLGFLSLVVCGSIVAVSAYIWLLRVSTPARVSTYAYVNPVVAVLLGAAFAGEALTTRRLVAAAVIVSGVARITLAPRRG
jgi:drug/metabolite transporter (DMT)-like permease